MNVKGNRVDKGKAFVNVVMNLWISEKTNILLNI
jgi:hypothetical protein